jgi:hypothetical protein
MTDQRHCRCGCAPECNVRRSWSACVSCLRSCRREVVAPDTGLRCSIAGADGFHRSAAGNGCCLSGTFSPSPFQMRRTRSGLLPACVPHQAGNHVVAIAAGQPDDLGTERSFVLSRLGMITPGCPGQPHQGAGFALGCAEPFDRHPGCGLAPGRAQQFPRTTSLSMVSRSMLTICSVL